ncbi:hypothetical protein RJT34_10181 [Clitoria ternatea]|uniref:Uncharacterized protein n=1 Tax=Clitoria ternatea TaxID=43366 RepID=A0AAN9PVV4_CLITE
MFIICLLESELVLPIGVDSGISNLSLEETNTWVITSLELTGFYLPRSVQNTDHSMSTGNLFSYMLY